jgi:clan AA aspartic protease (TIGR02281 family)
MAAHLTRPMFKTATTATTDPAAPASPAAPQAETLPSAPARTLEGDAVVLPYEGSGHSLALPVEAGDLDLSMLFDTGATLTTMNRATLRRLGVPIPADAPVLELRTANGPAKAPVVLVPRLWVGGVEVSGVTVGVCEPCADDEVVGLLGLNVTGRFLVTLDTARKEVSFAPRAGAEDRLLDVGPWLALDANLRAWPDGRVKAEIHANNNAPRAITAAEVALTCADDATRRWVKPLGAIGAGEYATREVALEGAEDCATWKVALASARW